MADTEPSREDLLRLGEEAFRAFKAKELPTHTGLGPAEMQHRHDHLEALVHSQSEELKQIRAALGMSEPWSTSSAGEAQHLSETAVNEIQTLRGTIEVATRWWYSAVHLVL